MKTSGTDLVPVSGSWKLTRSARSGVGGFVSLIERGLTPTSGDIEAGRILLDDLCADVDGGVDAVEGR